MAKLVNEPVLYKLGTPITITLRSAAGEETETVELFKVRPPVVGDLKAIENIKGQAAQGAALAARLTGYDVAVIDKVLLSDFKGLFELVQDFLPDGPETGAT